MVVLKMNHLSKGRLVALSVVLIAVVLIASSYAYLVSLPPHEGPQTYVVSYPFEFSIQLTKDSFQLGEYIPINLTLRNISNKTLVITWSSFFKSQGKILPFDVLFTDLNDTYIYQVSEVQAQAGSIWSSTLEPDTELVATFVWRQHWDKSDSAVPLPPVQEGTYFVKGLSRSMVVAVEGAKQTIKLQTPSIAFSISKT